jgi:prepilin-type N-terminal cleavage/methylation domain-containing protein
MHQLSRRLRHDEGGFTLIELLVASMIGTIILMSAFALIDMSFRGQRTVENRLDGVSRARMSMEQLTRQLRSQVCLGKGRAPILEATDNRVIFYASVAPAPTTPSARQTVQQRTLEYVPGAGGRGSIRETVVDGTGTPPNLDFTGTARTRTIVDNIAPVAGVPLFRYYKYDPDTSPNVFLLAPPISADNRQVIVQIQTAFETFPGNAADADRVKTRLDNKVTVRTADPTDPTRSPKCI